jgi:prevent-host-death family protein
MKHNGNMKTVGIREARQNITALIEHVRKGREVTITDRGKPVARLIGPAPVLNKKPFPDLSEFRKSLRVAPGTGEALVQAIVDERNGSSY